MYTIIIKFIAHYVSSLILKFERNLLKADRVIEPWNLLLKIETENR